MGLHYTQWVCTALSGSALHSLRAASPGILSLATQVSGTKPKGSLGTKGWIHDKAFIMLLLQTVLRAMAAFVGVSV